MPSSITNTNPIIFQHVQPTRATSESQGQTGQKHDQELINPSNFII